METVILWVIAILGWTVAGFLFWTLRKALDRVDWFQTWIEEFLQRTSLIYDELKRIDASGHFEADDEVGYFFKALKEILIRLAQMGVLNEEEAKEVEEKQENVQEEQKISAEELNRILAERRRKAKPATIETNS